MKIPTYPARPINGGPLDKALDKSGEWQYEPKYNGWRALIHIASGEMFNRKGEPLSITRDFQPALDQLRVTLDCEAFKWVDCEVLERRHKIGQGTLIVLDVLPEAAWRGTSYLGRRSWLNIPSLQTVFPTDQPAQNALIKSPIFSVKYAGKWWAELQRLNQKWGCEFYEGMVAKREDSKYPFQLRSSEEDFPFWMKHRWTF
jgi:hypothetical protein